MNASITKFRNNKSIAHPYQSTICSYGKIFCNNEYWCYKISLQDSKTLFPFKNMLFSLTIFFQLFPMY